MLQKYYYYKIYQKKDYFYNLKVQKYNKILV